MRQTRVPAQITTVEDKIAGNLSFTQILLFFAALMSSTIIYFLLPVSMKFTLYKIPLMILSSSFLLLLSVRIRGRVIFNWIFLITAYMARAKYYVYNKNDITSRDMVVEEKVKKVRSHSKQKETIKQKAERSSFADIIAVEQVLLNPNRTIRLAFRKGGIHATVSENQ